MLKRLKHFNEQDDVTKNIQKMRLWFDNRIGSQKQIKSPAPTFADDSSAVF
jgi:hypothetical protein